MTDNSIDRSSHNLFGQMSLEALTKALIMPANMIQTSPNSSPASPNPLQWIGGSQGPVPSSPFPGLNVNHSQFTNNQHQSASRETSEGSINHNDGQQIAWSSYPASTPQSRMTALPKEGEKHRLAELRAKLMESKKRSATPIKSGKPGARVEPPTNGTGAGQMRALPTSPTKTVPHTSSRGNAKHEIISKEILINKPLSSKIESQPLPTNRRASSADIELLVAEHRPTSPATVSNAEGEAHKIHTQAGPRPFASPTKRRGVTDQEIKSVLARQSPRISEQGEILDSDEEQNERLEASLSMNKVPKESSNTGQDPKTERRPSASYRKYRTASTNTTKPPSETGKGHMTPDKPRPPISMANLETRRSSVQSLNTNGMLSPENESNKRINSHDNQPENRVKSAVGSRQTEPQKSILEPRDVPKATRSSSQQPSLGLGRNPVAGGEESPHRRQSVFKDLTNHSSVTDETLNTIQRLEVTANGAGAYIPSHTPVNEVSYGSTARSGIQTDDLSPQDISDWLIITDFHDVAYRERLLKRFRRKKDLEKERLALEEEERQEWEERLRIGRTASIAAIQMPPPPSLPRSSKENQEDVGFQIKDMAKLTPEISPTSIVPERADISKRPHADSDPESRTGQSATKAPRLEYGNSNGVKTTLIKPWPDGPVSPETRALRDNAQNPEYRRRSRSPEGSLSRRSRSPPFRLPYPERQPLNDYDYKAHESTPDHRYGRHRSPSPGYWEDYHRSLKNERPLEDRIQDSRPPTNSHRGNYRGRGSIANLGHRNGQGPTKPRQMLNFNPNGQ